MPCFRPAVKRLFAVRRWTGVTVPVGSHRLRLMARTLHVTASLPIAVRLQLKNQVG